MLFSTNRRGFKLDESLNDQYAIDDRTGWSLDDDFSRQRRAPLCWFFQHRDDDVQPIPKNVWDDGLTNKPRPRASARLLRTSCFESAKDAQVGPEMVGDVTTFLDQNNGQFDLTKLATDLLKPKRRHFQKRM